MLSAAGYTGRPPPARNIWPAKLKLPRLKSSTCARRSLMEETMNQFAGTPEAESLENIIMDLRAGADQADSRL